MEEYKRVYPRRAYAGWSGHLESVRTIGVCGIWAGGNVRLFHSDGQDRIAEQRDVSGSAGPETLDAELPSLLAVEYFSNSWF
jgi:hypothetical protein